MMTGYGAYKASSIAWIDVLPAHWEVKPLLAVARERDVRNDGLVEENLLSLSYGNIVRKDISSNEGLLPESFETYQIVEPNDVVFRLTDLQNDKRSLRTGQVCERGIITSAYLAVEPTGISPDYFSHLLRAYDLLKVFYSMGGGLRQSMKYDDVRRMPVVLPPLPEQIAIAAFLDRETGKIDALVEEQKRLIELLKEKRQAVISHAVTKGLDSNARMKPSGVEWLGDVPEHWGVTRLKFVAVVQTGTAKGKDLAGQKTMTVPYLRVANVQDGYIDLSDVAEIEVPVGDLDRYLLRPGDVLMNEGGDFDKLGRGGIWDGSIDPCIHQNHVFAVRPHGVLPEWLNMVTSSAYGRFYFMSRSKQSTNLASISSTNVMELPIVLPPVDEQGSIIAWLTKQLAQVRALEQQCKRSISLLQERRSALISAAVTGKIDMRDAAAQEQAA